MEKEEKTILVCSNHMGAYPTPFISTFAFRQCELWCPYCGDAIGMFDGGTRIPWTQELQDRKDKYKEYYSEYLHANAITYASGIEWQGKDIHPRDLPQEEKGRLKVIRETAWKENVKLEDLQKS